MNDFNRMAGALAAVLAITAAAGAGHAETAAQPPPNPPADAPAGSINPREQAGLDVMAKLGWGTNADTRALDEDLWHIINEANFGVIWSRPGLSLRDREVVSLTVLIAIGSSGVTHIFEHAHDVGLTDAEIKEIILQTIPYAGQPRALQAMAAFKQFKAKEKATR
jgi:4-carboxymuconolactone decarboxylase